MSSSAKAERCGSPDPSCVSMRSHQSMDKPVNLREGNSSLDFSVVQQKRCGSPDPSCVSLKSDQSMDKPVNLGGENTSVDFSLVQAETCGSPEPSCVSMKSNQSMDKPVNLKEGNSSPDHRVQKETPDIRKNNESIFKELEHKLISLVKDELKRFEKLVSLDYPASSRKEVVDKADQSSIRDGLLKITLHVLRSMNQTDLANELQIRLAPACHQQLKYTLEKKYLKIHEGISHHGNSALLKEIYTELYITESESGGVNKEHEVKQIETASRRSVTQDKPINCNDLFKEKSTRTVLTKGVAGIGKTVSVQKFILDWSEGKANQDVLFIFPLPFRELNLMKTKKCSLLDLLFHFFADTKDLKPRDYYRYKVMFIFDGLDECRLPLDFQNNEILSDVAQSASVDVLLTNLIKGNLLPSALLWITSRPAACGQIPREYVDQVTEVRGFSDLQKEEYFKKKINENQSLARKIITHIKSSRSLYIMCHIPVFCWISATVLKKIFDEAESREIPRTLTQMFTHFLIFQINKSKQKYEHNGDTDLDQTKKIVWTLGKLAFQQLEKGNLIFYEEDLRECGIDVQDASVYSGLCTQIFKEEYGMHLGQVFSFVHLSVQEFLSALFAFLSFLSENRNVLDKETVLSQLSDFLKFAVDKALQSENGHLDLFLRFLLGLSLESNQTILRGLLPLTEHSSYSKEETVSYIKEKIRNNLSPEKSINLFHSLNELNDHSLVQEVQTYLNRRKDSCLSGAKLSQAQWSALVFVLLNSETELDEFDLKKYDSSEECLQRLLPVINATSKVVLRSCNLSDESCGVLASALSSNSSCLRELDMSDNNLQDLGVKLLSDGLKSPHCKLKKLSLCWCNLTKKSCAVLVSVLDSSNLRELELSNNELQDSGVKLLFAGLENPQCKLESLRLCDCNLTDESCAALASALSSENSGLKELDLSDNELQDLGVKQLSAGLENPHCKLGILRLSGCSITQEGFAALVSALKTNPSHLRELNLNYSQPGELGLKLLSDLLEDPHCKLENLQLECCSITEEGSTALASALTSNPSYLKVLNLDYNEPGEAGVNLLTALQEDPLCKLESLQIGRLKHM